MYGLAAGFLAIIAIFMYDTKMHHRVFSDEMKQRRANYEALRDEQLIRNYYARRGEWQASGNDA